MSAIQLKYYGYHPYNNPTHSERNVELPIAFWFLEKFGPDLANVVEVGEVTPFYHAPRHPVYDVVTEIPTTIKMNAADMDFRGRHLLSISTIEHIGLEQYGQPPAPELLPVVLKKMLASKTYLITFALGFNRYLEDLIKDEPYFIIERTAPTKWQQTGNKRMGDYKYHSPWYAGNGICVLTNLENLRFEFRCRSWLQVLGALPRPPVVLEKFRPGNGPGTPGLVRRPPAGVIG